MNCLPSLGRRNRGFESHRRHECLVCVCVYCVCVVLCLGRGPSASWSLAQGVPPSVIWSWNWKISPVLQSGSKRREKNSGAIVKASQQLRLVLGVCYQPHARPETCRSKVSLFVWIMTITLYGKWDPNSSSATASIALRIRHSSDTWGGIFNTCFTPNLKYWVFLFPPNLQ
jgi:hypothetical protein